ncbi:MAG: hypothetical protein WD846_00525 [Patescibacteria group bacterium]
MGRFSEWARGHRPERWESGETYDFVAGFGDIHDALGIEKPTTAVQHIRRVRDGLDAAGYVPAELRMRFQRNLTDLTLRTVEQALDQGSPPLAEEALSYITPDVELHDIQRKRLERVTRRVQWMPRHGGGHPGGRTPA